MPGKGQAVIPPDLAQHIGVPTWKALNDAERDGLLGLYDSGFFSAEDIAAELHSIKLGASRGGGVGGTFACKYLGSVPVAAAKLTPAMWEMFGKKVISTAYNKIKVLKIKPVDVFLHCSPRGIRVVLDSPEPSVIEDEPLGQVEFAGVDSTDKKRFAYLTHYSRLGLIFCHLFSGKKNDVTVSSIQTLVAGRPKPPPITEADKHEKTTGATLGIFEVDFVGQVPINDIGRVSLAITASEEVSVKRQLAQSVTYSLRKLKIGPTSEVTEGTPAIMVVSSEGIRTVELASRDTLSSIWIEHIQYTTEIVGKKSRYFALIANERSEQRTCFIYSCKQNEASQICEKLNEAKDNFKEDMQARAGNPFMAATKITEPVTGILADCQIPRRNLIADVAIGAGQFGEVYLAKEKRDNGSIAHRAVKMLRGGAAADDKALFLKEAEVNLKMKHENIVRVTGVCFSSRPWLVVLELCSYGDLQGVLQNCGQRKFTLRYSEQLSYCLQLAKALEFVASQKFVHLDVAARNIMVHHGHQIKLGDFGLAHPYDEGKPFWVMRKTMQMSIRWLAHEIMGPPPKCAGEKTDVWAFGVTVWEIFTYCKHRPFHKHRLQDVQVFVRAGGRLAIPKVCPKEMYQMMNWCWQKSVAKRPRFSQVIKELEKFTSNDGGEVRDVGLVINMMIEEEAKRQQQATPPSSPGPDNRLSLISMDWDGTDLDMFDN